ncbi:hypothetical protein [Marinoscillum sp.]|uniref:hypothetical protein n=1 Tax=Marinoscillum sp. TaxID=2024838 RepID=UPI003BAB4540
MKGSNWLLISILALVCLFILASIVYIVFNRGNDKIIELSFKSLLIPVSIAFGLLIVEFLKPLDTLERSIPICLTEDPFILFRLVTHVDGTLEDINEGTMDVTTFYASIKDSINVNTDEERNQLAEIFVLHLLNRRYSQHWQIEYKKESNFFDVHVSQHYQKEGADSKVKKVDVEYLHDKYPKDHLIQKIHKGIDFTLPAGTTINIMGQYPRRIIHAQNRFITLSIEITKTATATLPHIAGKTAKKVLDALDLPRNESYHLDFYGYDLKIRAAPNRVYKWHPKTLEQMDWVKEMTQYLDQSYGWRTIETKMESI